MLGLVNFQQLAGLRAAIGTVLKDYADLLLIEYVKLLGNNCRFSGSLRLGKTAACRASSPANLRALVANANIPLAKPRGYLNLVAGAGFEPTTFGL